MRLLRGLVSNTGNGVISTEGIVAKIPISIQNLVTSRYIIKHFKNNYLICTLN